MVAVAQLVPTHEMQLAQLCAATNWTRSVQSANTRRRLKVRRTFILAA